MNFQALVEAGLAGHSITREQAVEVLRVPDGDVFALVAAASRVRRHHFGNQVKLNYLVNVKSGLCPEDCNYCSQALGSSAEILRYSWLTPEAALHAAEAGIASGASTVCLVASGRGPSNREVDKVADMVSQIRGQYPQVKICTCLGFLDEDKVQRLAEAGSDRYNHNLNTAEEIYADICSTHTYADRASTVETAAVGGLSPCSGLIAGMGESDAQLVDVAFALRELCVDSLPVNFLLPFEGTPLASHLQLSPLRCLRILAMVRFVNPDVEIRAAAGREYHLRAMQPLALEICDSIFLGDYLTSEGSAAKADLAMIADSGFEIVGTVTDPDGCAAQRCGEDASVVDSAGVALRRCGVGAGQGC